MSKRTQYRSASSAKIRELLAELYAHGIYPRGYATQLAERLGQKRLTVYQNLIGRRANLEIVTPILEEAEKILQVRASKPKALDCSQLTVEELVDQKLLPNNFAEQVAERVGVAASTVHKITAQGKRSQKIEEGLRQLAGQNQELETVHRLEMLIAVQKRSPVAN